MEDLLSKMQSLSNQVTSVLANKETAAESQQRNRELLGRFLESHPEMTEQRLEQLLGLKD